MVKRINKLLVLLMFFLSIITQTFVSAFVPITAINNSAQRFNPTAPDIYKSINWNNTIYSETAGVWDSDKTEKRESSYFYINILDYAADWNDFQNKYQQLRIDYNGYVEHSKADKHDYNSYHYLSISDFRNYSKTAKIFDHYHPYVQNEGWGWTEVRYKLDNMQLQLDFFVYARAKNGWNSMNTWTRTKLQVNNININSNFNFEQMKANLTRELSNPLPFYSNNSNNPQNTQNWQKIKLLMLQKIKQALNDSSDSQGWFEFLKPTYLLQNSNGSYSIKTNINIYNHKNGYNQHWEFVTPLIFDSDYNLEMAKQNLNHELANTLTYQSDTATNILDSQNWNAITTNLKNIIFTTLSKKGTIKEWEQLVKPNFALINENSNYFIKTSFNIFNAKTANWENCVFKTKLNFSLSAKYWKSKIQERILITPGKIPAENGALKTDIEEVISGGDGKNNQYNNGKIKYHTKTFFQYIEPKQHDNDADYDTVKINGINLNAVNGMYTFVFDDKNNINTYDIEIVHKPNPKITGDLGGNFKLTIVIGTITPSLTVKLMGWNASNIDYEKLTSKYITDPNNHEKQILNPHYDPEISKETGTKKQLIWVNKQSKTPFPLDPIAKNGTLIVDNNLLENGFIAEASSVGAGYENFYDSANIEKVTRYKTNSMLETEFLNGYEIPKSKTGDINTSAGFYHFVIQEKSFADRNGNYQTPFYQHKFVFVDKDKTTNYGYFLDAVTKKAAVNFWNSMPGMHLKNYLIQYKKWNPNDDFTTLSYEKVLAFWRDYVSDIRSHFAINESTNNFKNLADLEIATLKMNEKSTAAIKANSNKYIKEQVNSLTALAQNDKDYIVEIFKNDKWEKIVAPDWETLLITKEIPQKELILRIKALSTSLVLIGLTNKFKVINDINYDETKVVDLAKIDSQKQEYNFNANPNNAKNSNNAAETKNEIAANINSLLQELQAKSKENDAKMTVDEQELTNFIAKTQANKPATLNITITATADSTKTKGQTVYQMINNPAAKQEPKMLGAIISDMSLRFKNDPSITRKSISNAHENLRNSKIIVAEGANINDLKQNQALHDEIKQAIGKTVGFSVSPADYTVAISSKSEQITAPTPAKITVITKPNSKMITGTFSYETIISPKVKSKQPNVSVVKQFFRNPINLFFMTLISCCVIASFFVWIILKNCFSNKIGGKSSKKLKRTSSRKENNNED